jgi:hypothetical protein
LIRSSYVRVWGLTDRRRISPSKLSFKEVNSGAEDDIEEEEEKEEDMEE